MEELLHAGHRERMKERLEKEGLDGFQDHEVLEFMLYYALPYKNTNEIAHYLLNKFGSIYGVFSATKEELRSVPGIGKHAATYIKFLPELFRRYSLDCTGKHRTYDDFEKLSEHVINHFIGKTKEHVQLFLFDTAMRIIGSMTIHNGGFSTATVSCEHIGELVFNSGASYFIIAHNHPSGDVTPSTDDLLVTREIYRAMRPFNRELLEHYIVGNDKILPILDRAKEMFDK